LRDSAAIIRQQRWKVLRARALRLLERYDPNQPRDEDGEWTSDGGSGDGSESPGATGGAGQSQVNAASNVTQQAVAKAQAAIASIPAAHRELLKDVPVDILSNTDEFPEHMQRASGFYDPSNRQIKIAETVASYPGGDLVSINVAKTVSHELGHAYDDATGAANSLDARDVADSVRRTRGATATERINARYFTSSSKEMFAELYALAHSPEKAEKYFGIPRARAERIWAKPLAQMRAMGPNGVRPPSGRLMA
jgi:hypothetical protein